MSKKYTESELEIMANGIAEEILANQHMKIAFWSTYADLAGLDLAKYASKSAAPKLNSPDDLEILADTLERAALNKQASEVRLPRGVNWQAVGSDLAGEALDTAVKLKLKRDAQERTPGEKDTEQIEQEHRLKDLETYLQAQSKTASTEKLAFRRQGGRRDDEERPRDPARTAIMAGLGGVALGIGGGLMLAKGKKAINTRQLEQRALKETQNLRDFGNAIADKYKQLHIEDSDAMSELFKDVSDPSLKGHYQNIFNDVKNTAKELGTKLQHGASNNTRGSMRDEILELYDKHIATSNMPDPAKQDLRTHLEAQFKDKPQPRQFPPAVEPQSYERPVNPRRRNQNDYASLFS